MDIVESDTVDALLLRIEKAKSHLRHAPEDSNGSMPPQAAEPIPEPPSIPFRRASWKRPAVRQSIYATTASKGCCMAGAPAPRSPLLIKQALELLTHATAMFSDPAGSGVDAFDGGRHGRLVLRLQNDVGQSQNGTTADVFGNHMSTFRIGWL
jgi:hypothetical protein